MIIGLAPGIRPRRTGVQAADRGSNLVHGAANRRSAAGALCTTGSPLYCDSGVAKLVPEKQIREIICVRGTD